VVNTGSIIRLQGVGANFSAPQLSQKLIILTFETGKDLTVTCSSIWSEEAGVNYFVFDSHFKPKKRVQLVPLTFVHSQIIQVIVHVGQDGHVMGGHQHLNVLFVRIHVHLTIS